MKTGKDEEKIMGPMFPRLHVNDADKGGPRAPPRNKMALYEQLSIPSQKYGSGVVPLNPKTTTNMVPSASSSQGSGVERNLVFPRHLPPPTPTHWSEKFHARHFDVRNGNALGAQLEHRKKVGDEDDFMVPVFVQAREGKSHDKTQNTIDRESRSSTSSARSGRPVERQNISKKDSKQDNLVAVNFKQEARSDRKENMTGVGKSGSAVISATDQSNREKINRHMKEAKTLSNQAHKESAVSDLSRSYDGKTCSNQQSRAGVRIQSSREDDDCVESTRDIEGASASHPRSESCYGEDHGVPNEAENVSKHKSNSNRMCISLQLENADKGDDLSETSIVDSISDLDISPDDIVGFIGQKHFWKARRAIVKFLLDSQKFVFDPSPVAFYSQQRVFAMQVFELHRLIKVQRLIAGSPHLLLEHGAFLAKSSLKGSPAKKLVPESVVKPLPCVATNCKGGNSEKSNEKMEHSAKNAVGKTSLSSVKTCSQSLNYPPHAGNPQPVVARPDNKMGPWCFHQSPGPQWLVPVMSSSEGLVYKPYMGPGFPGAVYGGRGPFGSTPMTGNFPNSDFGISASHHQGIGVFPRTSPVGHAYIPPYGMPIINPSMSASTVEQVRQFGGAAMVPGGMVNSNTEQQSSCNVPAHENGSVSQPEKFQASKGSELQGSKASSPGDRAKSAGIGHDPNARDPLLLFPMAPVVSEEPSHSHETAGPQPARAIKVVPHNPWSATESAARIFRFIQEERKQYNPI